VRAAVLDAADKVLGSSDEPITVKNLAEISGISEPTIYRRWRTAENVLVDAAVRRQNRLAPIETTGDLRADLLAWATGMEASLTTDAAVRFLAAIVHARAAQPGESADMLAPFMSERVEQLRTLLEVDGAPGALTVERLLDRVLAPLYVRQLIGYVSTSGARELVDELLGDTGL
jgi:AcrR family transcriptional regulator